jgi:hypothetical protein
MKFPPAQAHLALHYAKLGEIDLPRVSELLEQPLKMRIPEAYYAKGLILEKQNDALAALNFYHDAAKMGMKDAGLSYAKLLLKLADDRQLGSQANIDAGRQVAFSIMHQLRDYLGALQLFFDYQSQFQKHAPSSEYQDMLNSAYSHNIGN